MKTKIILTILALILFSFNSCKKTKTTEPSPEPNPVVSNNTGLFNKWEVISGLPGAIPLTKYIIIKSDSSVFMLDSAQYGFKKLDYGLLTSSQVLLDDFYDYSISQDTLKLTRTNTTILLKKNTTSANETNWVVFVNPIDSINSLHPNGDPRQDMGFDGTNFLWTADANTDTIYKINPSSHQVSGKLKLNSVYYYGCINYESGNIWISNNQKIDKLNSTGILISTSPVLANKRISAITLIGQDMWYSDVNSNISMWNTVSNAITTQIQTPQPQFQVSGMEYVGGYLYLSDSEGGIYKCQLSPFRVLVNYRMKMPRDDGYGYNGITHDGTKFWINFHHKLMKLSI